jgi:hypothetical protein
MNGIVYIVNIEEEIARKLKGLYPVLKSEMVYCNVANFENTLQWQNLEKRC